MGFLSNVFGKKKYNNNLNRYYDAGAGAISSGTDIYNKAIGSLDSLDADYEKRLAEGLPSDVRQSYANARGAVTDEEARSNNAFSANLRQRARAGGGQITDQAAVDASIENNSQTAGAAFSARNQIYADEASASLENTNKLLDAIQSVRTTKLGAGLSEQGLGADIYKSALGLDRNGRNAMMQAIVSIFGAYSSAAGKGGASAGGG